MKKKIKTVELTLASMFVVLIALGANITTLIPGMVVGGVPITLQTFFAILAGLILGSRLGVLRQVPMLSLVLSEFQYLPSLALDLAP